MSGQRPAVLTLAAVELVAEAADAVVDEIMSGGAEGCEERARPWHSFASHLRAAARSGPALVNAVADAAVAFDALSTIARTALDGDAEVGRPTS